VALTVGSAVVLVLVVETLEALADTLVVTLAQTLRAVTLE
jgi:hypothetical protein